ncbi:TetR/AcrR family transcriptional regulator [Eubacterium sp. AM05-23]|uniref:TetR/AcrR family transcriptional regulator n=1 Tax=Eubacterium TaxID=1730 RepID=UPI000E504471|nr:MULTISPECIES: TetR/AcrR family transcriptional regulator [Eubacterium]MDO5431211.1 TetR/AcrR family transcriptional regulator [Eubacterium sp.]RHO54967.1 TetR/AcrR family transcriptional regulator [Eubacterium sp. AM05-23]
MANYKNGLETKESLYQSAKKIFYQKGYDKTTVKDIITDARTKQGLLNYYFGAKENLAVQIYKDFCNDVVFCVDEKKDELGSLPRGLLLDMIGYRAYFKALFTDDAVMRFYAEVSKLPLFARSMLDLRDYFFSLELESEAYTGINPKLKERRYFEYLKSLTVGMEIQVFRDVLEKQIDLELQDAVDWFFFDYYSFLFTDAGYIRENIEASRQVVSRFIFEITPTFEISLSVQAGRRL